jgi:hypothetical protein
VSVLKGRRKLLTSHHFAGLLPTGTRTGATPTNTDPGVAALAASLTDELQDAFATIDWAEDEITRATRRHPGHADVLYHGFALIRPRDIGPGMSTELVYRSHAAELLDRIAAGADTRPATAAELCLVCCEASLRAPMHGAAAGLYFRMWLQAFPRHPITGEQAGEQVHYEKLYGSRIDDLQRTLRHKAADPGRQLRDIDCAGKHHGTRVACRYATASALPAPRIAGPTTTDRRTAR